MIALKNARVVLENEILPNGVVLIDGERIAEIGASDAVAIPDNADCYDVGGKIVGPGFVDIHVHGGNGRFLYAEPIEGVGHFLSHGETTVLPTLYYDLSREDFIAAIERVKSAMGEGIVGSVIGGFYMEGPYMNPKYGASPEKNKWKGEIRLEDYAELLSAAGAYAKVWAVAPERDGVDAFMRDAKMANPEAVFAVGHSEATPAEVGAVKKYGVRLQTHCMNATGRPECGAGTRSCGPDEACLMDGDIYAELISDSQAIHVPADLQRFVLFVKGVDRVILISDSFVSDETPPPHLAHITDLQYDANGELCGSKLTLDAACRNVIKHTGCSITDAFKMASRNPARALGMDRQIGTIEVGKRADLVIVDDDFNVENVMVRGEFYK